MTERYNLNIKKWGSAGWIYLMAIALTYPDSPSALDKERYRVFFTANQFVIPCPICRKHYADNLTRLPLDEKSLATRRALAEWIHRMRNEVNKSKQKPEVDFLHFLADYLPPSGAKTMLSADEMTQLREIDEQKNAEFLKEANTKEEVPTPKPWWYWVLLIGGIVAALLFVSIVIKAACKQKIS